MILTAAKFREKVRTDKVEVVDGHLYLVLTRLETGEKHLAKIDRIDYGDGSGK